MLSLMYSFFYYIYKTVTVFMCFYILLVIHYIYKLLFLTSAWSGYIGTIDETLAIFTMW